MSSLARHHQPEFRQGCIVIIDDELLSQDCLAEAIRGEFPQMRIIGIPTVHDLVRPAEIAIEGVLLKVHPRSGNSHNLTHDVRAVCQYFARAPVVVISSRDDISTVEAAAAAGARGFIPVTTSFKIAIAALRLVLAGGTYYPHSFNGKLDPSNVVLEVTHENTIEYPSDLLSHPALPTDVPQDELGYEKEFNGFNAAFTAREIDVLTALRQGRSNKWIAHHLNLSENTVKVHIRNIMRKLNATNRTQVVVLSQSLVPNGKMNGG
ncbi:response regulator transcription factor [Microvirga sp. TS319]|uniref:response regulator transcription factor n=1 Tax=Microvirga sp. TS319 TaxID=3241165 RepID=UPI00351A6286